MPTKAEPIQVNIPKRAFLEVYHYLLKSENDIDFLYGGRDSGKSQFVAMILLILCMSLPYFRCVLLRKVFNTVKESQWQTLKDVATRWGVDHLFKFNINPLEIHCVNGNRFICRGLDDPGNLKSIANPSHAWVEEGNQIESDDWTLLITSLRYNAGRVKIWFTFNPETYGDFEEFWLYKIFFADRPAGSFQHTWKIPVQGKEVEIKYGVTHSTYKDNRYCKPERAAYLENLINTDPYYYKVFTLGQWGNRSITDPYCYAFAEKHIGTTSLDRLREVCLSFDFNVNPITCGVYQEQGPGKIRVVETINLGNSDIYKMCDYIKTKYPGCMFLVTGDATGRNTTALVQDGINYYTVIKTKLRLNDLQIKVPTVNPSIEENRVLVNTIFHSVDVLMDPVKCKHLIFDCRNVSVNDLGKIDKGTRSDPKKRADHLDHWRYYLNTFHKKYLKK